MLSMTVSDSAQFKRLNVLAQLRRHGFVWEGRGGAHTAPCRQAALDRRRQVCGPR